MATATVPKQKVLGGSFLIEERELAELAERIAAAGIRPSFNIIFGVFYKDYMW